MLFASLSDLVARSNVRRVFQLAVPADRNMPSDAALRVAVDGGDLSPFGSEVAETLGMALSVISQALNDASDLVQTAGVPGDTVSPVVTRLTVHVALYYLQGAERMTESVQALYDDAIKLLDRIAKGQFSIGGVAAAVEDDEVAIESSPYPGSRSCSR